MTRQHLSVFVASALLTSAAGAQIKSDGSPAAMTAPLPTDAVPVDFVQPPDVDAYMAEDEANGYRPFRYGALLPVDIGMESEGVWNVLDDGTQVWRFRIYSPDAYSIGLEFDDFVLPEGASVFMYDATLETVYGAYGAINNQPNEEILMEPFPGDEVIFEYLQPAGVEGQAQLHLGTVIYDYRNVDQITDEELANPGEFELGSCLVDVNCPEGDPWNVQKRAVVRTLSGGGLCSGALINNTAEDGTAYVYTADHCGQGSNTNFRFNYQTSGCGFGGAPTNQSVSGATLLATTGTYDSRLLRINNTIPTNYNAYFAGWTRSSTNPNFVFSMGHPSGGPKKISVDQNGATKGSIGVFNSAWFVDWSLGTLEGGSSGGPLFQQDGLVVGAACCVSNFSCSSQAAWYGRFDRFYSTMNAGQWLDPVGANPTVLDGFDPTNPGGGGGEPMVDSTTPASLPTVIATSPTSLTINGSGFTGVTDVRVNGVSLSGLPPQWTLVDDGQIDVNLLGPFALPSLNIEVVENGTIAQIDVPVSTPATPTLDLQNSDPGFIIQAVGLNLWMSSDVNDTHFLIYSPTNVGTSFPGIVDLGIGNNGLSLFQVATLTVDSGTGYAEVSFPIQGLPFGTKVYFQSVVLPAVNPGFPLETSNVEVGTILF
ncbi:MAG: trypsin-like peptidase domain-containing protein [Planctomycetota bacterium]